MIHEYCAIKNDILFNSTPCTHSLAFEFCTSTQSPYIIYRYQTKHAQQYGAIIGLVIYYIVYHYYQAKHAQQYGAIGLVIYSDPADYAVDDDTGGAVYPDTWWLPGTGVQRGSLYIKQGLGGDPLTPAYPSSGGYLLLSYSYLTHPSSVVLVSFTPHVMGTYF